ncbi:MAG: VCBS repeat-containing protein [Planctomycetes bacterium]|nr:VCBS repeat-containing protein [Planctomycetota bacterium]
MNTCVSRLVCCAVATAVTFTPVAAGETPFTEEAAARGIVYTPVPPHPWGFGVAMADLDGDGDPDIVTLGAADGHLGLYENDGRGVFTDREPLSGIPSIPLASGVTAADYDGDGDLDLYISRRGAPNVLLRNDGGWTFSDVTLAAGVGDDGQGQGCAWADYDADGWLDLYVSNRTSLPSEPHNRLYHNLGDGTFEEVAEALGVDAGADPTFQATWFDYDRDGLVDLYLCTDKGEDCTNYSNHLFRNVGGTFIDVTDASGTAACIGCMGTAIADLDGNGFSDMYCSNTPAGNVLFMNAGDGTFAESAESAGMGSFGLGWGVAFFDYDNDGYQDLYVCNSNAENRLYDYNGIFPAVDVAEALGVAHPGPSFCTAVADVDGDGDLDLLLESINEPIRLYINHAGETRNWLELDLVGLGPNTHAVGAWTEVSVGSTQQVRQVIAGIGFKSMSTLVQHFGLGDAELVDQLTVTWPGGGETALVNVPVNRRLTLINGELPEPELVNITLTGPDVVVENTTAVFTAVASYYFAEPGDVTADAQWAVDPAGAGTFDAPGVFTAGDVVGDTTIQITASLGDVTATVPVVIQDVAPPPPPPPADPPEIGVDVPDDGIDFGDTIESATLPVHNVGDGVLIYTIDTDQPWLTVTPDAGTSAGPDDVVPHTVLVDRSDIEAGSDAVGVIAIQPADVDVATVLVTVRASKAPAPSPDQDLDNDDAPPPQEPAASPDAPADVAHDDVPAPADVPPADDTAPAATPADDTEPSTDSGSEPAASEDTAPSPDDTPAPSAGDTPVPGDPPPGADLPPDSADASPTPCGVACGAVGFIPILGMLLGLAAIRRTAPTRRR